MFLDAFTHLKDLFGFLLRLSSDALHVHMGLFLFVAVAALRLGRRPMVTAFWAVLALCIVTEVFDLLYDLQVGRRMRWLNSFKDIVNGMIWPAALMLGGSRFLRWVGTSAEPNPGTGSPERTDDRPTLRGPSGEIPPELRTVSEPVSAGK